MNLIENLNHQIVNSEHYNEDNLLEAIDGTVYPAKLNGSITASGKFSMSKMKLYSDEVRGREGQVLLCEDDEGNAKWCDVGLEYDDEEGRWKISAETSLEDIEGEPSNTLTFNKNGKLEETDRIRVYNNDEYEEQTLEIVSTSEYTDGDGRNCYNGSNIEQYAIDSNANVSIRAAINGYNNQWGSAGIFVEADIDADTDTIETYIDLQAKHIAIDNGEDNAGKYLKVNQDQEIEFVNVEGSGNGCSPKHDTNTLNSIDLADADTTIGMFYAELNSDESLILHDESDSGLQDGTIRALTIKNIHATDSIVITLPADAVWHTQKVLINAGSTITLAFYYNLKLDKFIISILEYYKAKTFTPKTSLTIDCANENLFFVSIDGGDVSFNLSNIQVGIEYIFRITSTDGLVTITLPNTADIKPVDIASVRSTGAVRDIYMYFDGAKRYWYIGEEAV